ncbi:MAG: adenosylhomocysteinase [Candidatus Aenigmarchaeota archaeon]|nr:adenosylhomocysteinase [Candidatus Aenigmarchaeota archaeon]NIP41046.1 adenosylhomocysteinase [Candidatus Aenigmarchaeota archaeon]NIQ17448.1 adenosylhomocysteinase [Candidatus Aenigmarchaeota archaeon]NIS73642.1 adenosylhomocysteinase [Candidatus Aenigmarchaeota archaeon]
MSKVKDMKLSKDGESKIKWAEDHMPVLMNIRKRFEKGKPLKGITIACCLHVTKETAVLMKTLKEGGAKVSLCGSNPLSTQDDIAAALVKEGINVFAWRGVNTKDYYWCIDSALDLNPNITMDDGGDLVARIHEKRGNLLKNIIAGTEETTTGVIRFRAMEKDSALKYPIIAINDAYTKYLFDNRYGTGQSTIDGILRSTSVLIAGKNFVVAGYGWCARGIAMRARGMGANVIVTEVDPLKALEAVMDGFSVMPMSKASEIGDIFVSATGDKSVISGDHISSMKSGAIIANSGHFDVEINIPELDGISKSKKKIRDNVEEYTLRNGRKIYLLAEGRLVNLAAAEGHPSEVMDMSFANQALVAEYILKNRGKLETKVYRVPKEIDSEIARLKLESMDIRIDKLTNEQEKYLTSWKEGT